jgi:hypothetical protein
MRESLIFLVVWVLWNPVATQADEARKVIVGVNTPGVEQLNDEQVHALVEQLQKNGVKTVRTGIGGIYNRFIIDAYQHGMGALVVIWPNARPNAKPHPGLSDAYPETFGASIAAQLAPIEAAGVPLTALQLGNEINGPYFNGDFLPALATGRVMGLSDLDNPNDPEGQEIAASYRAYLPLLAVLKDVRDHSNVNRRTPIISAGMGDGGLPGKRPGQKLDGVSVPATFAFLRRIGIDKLVDGYGVHVYPSGDPHRSASTRTADLKQDAFALCTRDKPCWLTEWGWRNTDQSCPLKDETRAQLTQLEREAFEPFVEQAQLAGILYYMWGGLPEQRTGNEDPAAIFRCGALTEGGRLAIAPM